MRPTAVHKLFPGGHCEISRNMPALVKYTQKEDTRIEGPWFYGTLITRKTAKDKLTLKDHLEMTLDELQENTTAA